MITHKQHLKTKYKYLGCKECLKDDPLFTLCPICDKPINNFKPNIDAHLDYHIFGKINDKGDII
jgi:hypothetical protein